MLTLTYSDSQIPPLLLKNMKFSIKDFFSQCDPICSFLQIWSYLLKKSWMENFIFCAVHYLTDLTDLVPMVSQLPTNGFRP